MAESDEFRNVVWDMPNDNNRPSGDQPAVMDPLSDIHEALNEPLSAVAYESPVTSEEGQPAQVNVEMSDDPVVVPTAAIQHYNNESASSSKSTEIPEWRTIHVTDPRKETSKDGHQSTFISYRIVSHRSSVRRRFQDFVWLYNVLYLEFPACFVPPLPDKHRMEYLKGDRFGSDFVERRRISLQRFLQRIARHPILGKAELFIMFLESSEFNDASARALREGQETVIDTIGDSLLNAFAKIRKRDPQFVEMRDRVNRLEETLGLLEKTLLRTNKRTEDIHQAYKDFSSSIRGLAQHEAKLEHPLCEFASAVDEYAQAMKTMTIHDTAWIGEIHDYMSYYSVMKGVLKLRDQKQLDYEELSEYLQSTIAERERTLQPHLHDSGYNIAGYVTGKINEVRGADADKIRKEKVLRLDERIRELRDAIEQTRQVSIAFSDQVKREDVYHARSKATEMRDALIDYTDSKVEFYQNGARVWRDVVRMLEQVEP